MSQNLLSLSFDDQQLARIDNALAALETELQGLISLTPDQRKGLYRMGPKLAEAVVQYRREHSAAKGGKAFVFVEDLEAVKGIGPEMAGAYREHLSLPSAED